MDLLPYFLCRYVPDSTSRMAHSFLCICRPIVSNTCSTGLENSVPERTQRQNQPAQHCRSTSQLRLRTQAVHYSGVNKGETCLRSLASLRIDRIELLPAASGNHVIRDSYK